MTGESAGAGPVVTGGPSTTRLPDGFQVQIDPRVAVSADGRHLVGGSPTRLLSLAPRAAEMIDCDGRLVVSDEATATVAAGWSTPASRIRDRCSVPPSTMSPS